MENASYLQLGAKFRIKRSSLGLLLILSIALSPIAAPALVGTPSTPKSNQQVSISNLQIKDSKGRVGQFNAQVSVNGKSVVQSQKLQRMDSGDTFSAYLATESHAGNGFDFKYNESQSGSVTGVGNNYELTVNPTLQNYSQANFNVDSYTTPSTQVIEDSSDNLVPLTTSITIGQAHMAPSLSLPGTKLIINSFNVSEAAGASTGITLVGAVYSAANNSFGHLRPDQNLGSVTIIPDTSMSTPLYFDLPTPVEINSSNTYTNATGGYFFFVFYRTDGNPSKFVFFSIAADSTSGDNGTMIIENSGSPQSDADSWTNTTEVNDVSMNYNAWFEFDPLDLQTKIANPSGAAGNYTLSSGLYTENDFRSGSQTYNISYNSNLVSTYTVLQNISYSFVHQDLYTSSVAYQDLPTNTNIDWTVSLISSTSYYPSNVTKYFVLPNAFTVVNVSDGVSLLTQGVDYTVGTSGTNVLVYMLYGAGNYIVHAQSPNQLYSATLSTFVNLSTVWTTQSYGYSGTLYPDQVVGDNVKANITNMASLDVMSGNVNASLRDENGVLWGNMTTGNYVDTSVFSETYAYGSSMQFTTDLDPNIPTGIWTFQFRWFNGTAAGSTAIEFSVYPQVDVYLKNPTTLPYEMMENDFLYIEAATLDLSHNDPIWVAPTVSWSLGNIGVMTDNGAYNATHESYTGNFQISKATFGNLQPNTQYMITLTWTDGPFSTTLTFDATVYFRASTSVSVPTVEYGSSFIAHINPVNVTGANSNLNVTGVVFDLGAYSFTPTYVPASEGYDLNITWNGAFDLGTNQINANWTYIGYRESVSYTQVTFTITFTVTDTTFPVFTNTQTDDTFVESRLGNSLSWTLTDLTPRNYTIYNNTQPIASKTSQTWTSGVPITLSMDYLTIGYYNFTIWVQDRDNNSVFSTAWITIIDIANPVISTAPSATVAMNEDSSGNVLTWQAGDRNPSNYTIYEDTNPVASYTAVSWTNATVVNYNIDHLKIYPLGASHNITIIFYDSSSNWQRSEITVNLTDNTAPNIGGPGTQTFEYTPSAGYTFQWNPSDTNNGTYEIWLNSTYLFDSGTFNTGTPISVTIPALNGSLGWYNYTLILTDPSNNMSHDTVLVHIQDTTAPVITIITIPADRTFNETGSGITIFYSLNDYFPSGSAHYNVTGPIGELSAIGGVWINDVSLQFPTGSRTAGVYEFTIYAIDGNGNLAFAIVTVTVNDVPVIVVSSTTVSMDEGSTGNLLTFTPSDQVPDTYAIYVDSSPTPSDSGTWTSGVDITFSIDGLTFGSHTVRLEVLDQTGLSKSVTVNVNVLDNTTPVLVAPIPQNFNFTTAETAVIEWTASDLHAGNYEIYINNALNTSGTWTNNVPVSLNITGLPISENPYIIKISFYDLSGNSINNTLQIFVKDPSITETKSVGFDVTSNVYEGDIETLAVVGWQTKNSDQIQGSTLTAQLFPLNIAGYPNGIPLRNFNVSDNAGVFTLMLNYTGLLVGNYQWVFNFTKDYYEPITLRSSVVTIQRHLLHIDIDLPAELKRSQEYYIAVNVTYADHLSGLQLNSIIGRTGAVQGIQLNFLILYTPLQGQQQVLQFNDPTQTVTNDLGFVSITLDRTQTENIKSIDGINITTTESQQFAALAYSVDPSLLPSVAGTNSFLVLFQDAIQAIRDNAIYVILVLISLVAAYVYISKKRKIRRAIKKSFIAESENAATELDGLMSIKAILITAGNTGIPFFESSFEGTQSSIDLTLVSGITSALSTFMGELASSPIGFETMEKESLTITSHKSEKSSMVVISNVHLPLVILDQIREGHNLIEAKHSDLLKNPEQAYNIDPVEIRDDLEIAGLKLSLKGVLRINERNLKRVSKQTSLTRKLRSNLSQLNDLVKWNSPDPMSIDDVIAHLKSKNMDHPMASRIVYLAYHNDVFFVD